MDAAKFADIAADADWFGERYAQIQKQPRINFQTRGTAATMNAPGVAFLGDPEAIILGFSRKYNAIIIRAADPDERGAYPFRHMGAKGSTRIFATKAFAVKHDIPIGKVKSYLGYPVDNMLVFPLDQDDEQAGAGNAQQQRAG